MSAGVRAGRGSGRWRRLTRPCCGASVACISGPSGMTSGASRMRTSGSCRSPPASVDAAARNAALLLRHAPDAARDAIFGIRLWPSVTTRRRPCEWRGRESPAGRCRSHIARATGARLAGPRDDDQFASTRAVIPGRACTAPCRRRAHRRGPSTRSSAPAPAAQHLHDSHGGSPDPRTRDSLAIGGQTFRVFRNATPSFVSSMFCSTK